MTAAIGALRVTLGANTAQFEAGMARAQARARRTGQEISGSFRRAQATSVTAMSRISAGAAAMGVAIGTIGTSLIAAGRQAFEYAASLNEASRAIGVTVEQYQILNRAAIENGFSMETAARALGILNRTLGQARAGSETAIRAFQQLGISRQQIDSFRQAGDALPVVMEALRGLRTSSEQAAAAQRLFGRSAAQLLPFLTQGADGYEELSRRAREAGLITEEQARRADEASDRLALLGLTIRTNLASALIGILPHIEAVIAALGRMASIAAQAINMIASIRIPGGGGATLGGGLMGAIPFYGPVAQAWSAMGGRQTGTLTSATARSILEGQGWSFGAPAGNMALDMSGGGGGGSRRRGGGGGGGDANRAIRNENEFQDELRRHRIDVLREMERQATDFSERTSIQHSIAALEREEYVARLAMRVRTNELTQVRADELQAAYDNAAGWARQGRLLEETQDHIEQRRNLTRVDVEQAQERLRLEIDGATTARQRRDAELRLLRLTTEAEIAARRRIENDVRASHEARETARREREGLLARYPGQRSQIIQGTMGPMEEFLSRLPSTAEQANEALQTVAAEGLQSITDGLTDAIMMTRSWGDVMKNIAKQIIADLIRIQIQRAIIGPIANALSAAFSGGVPVKIPGRAAGGPVLPGRMYMVGEKGPELLRMGAAGGHIIANDNIGRGGEVHVHQTFKFEGVAITQREFAAGLMATRIGTIEAIQQARRRAG